jgi:hypothetical protein
MPEQQDAAPEPAASVRQDAAALAKEEGFPLEVVEGLYESVLAELGQNARVREFLPVVVINRVRRELRRRKRKDAAPGRGGARRSFS